MKALLHRIRTQQDTLLVGYNERSITASVTLKSQLTRVVGYGPQPLSHLELSNLHSKCENHLIKKRRNFGILEKSLLPSSDFRTKNPGGILASNRAGLESRRLEICL